MKYHIITFGCQMNKSDSERIAAVLEKFGYKLSPQIEAADLIVVNMCSVRQSAVDRIYGLSPKFKKLKTKNSKLKTLLTGCILKSDAKRFKNYFDYVLSIKTLPRWKDILLNKKGFVYYPDLRIPRLHKKFDVDYFKLLPHYSNNFSAYIPIMTGCNNFCSYCVVPYAKGPEVCRPTKEILGEVKKVVKKGFKEIWLLGHNVNRYRSKSKKNRSLSLPVIAPQLNKYQKPKIINFGKLLKIINEIPGEFWISFTSSHPNYFSDELIKIIAECEKVSKYISLPIQSGNNEILKKMNRPYTVAQYKTLIRKIRKAIPNVSLSTDVIVGFPGETKEQFENTVKLFKDTKFDMAYIAEYSPRPGTTAFKIKDNVSKKEKQRRREVLTKILEKTSIENSKKYLGKTFSVLIQEITQKGALVGKTPFYKTVKIDWNEERPRSIGKIVMVKITDVMPWGLKGKLI